MLGASEDSALMTDVATLSQFLAFQGLDTPSMAVFRRVARMEPSIT